MRDAAAFVGKFVAPWLSVGMGWMLNHAMALSALAAFVLNLLMIVDWLRGRRPPRPAGRTRYDE
jgi:hypothetical protein